MSAEIGLAARRQPVADLEDAGRARISKRPIAHFSDHWLDGGLLPGVDRDTLAAALRDGFRAALTAARENVLPTSMLWVARGDTFAVDHIVGANAVTVVLFVPESALAGVDLTAS